MELRQLLIDYFSVRPEVAAVYIFGSHSTGKATASSDVDVAVLLADDFDLASEPLYRLDQAVALQAYLDREWRPIHR